MTRRPQFIGITFEIGITPWTGFDKDGFPLAQHDGFGDNPSIGGCELHHPFGFISRPRDPDTDKNGTPLAGKACNVLIGKIGNETHLFLCYDPRYIPNIPQLKKGGAAMYCAPGSFDVFDGEDGTKTTYVPIPGASKAHMLTTGLDGNGKPFIGIQHCDGMAVTMLEGSVVIKNNSGSVYFEINDQGVVVNGNMVVNGGMTAGSPAGAQPAALAPALVAYLQALETSIVASFNAVLAGLVSNGPAGAAVFQSSAAARAALMNAITAQKVGLA